MKHHIQQIIDHILHPVIEIAGPTPRGYKILQDLDLKIPSFVVTNTANDVTVYTSDDAEHHFKVDAVVDVRNLPYDDSSVGILLCSYLPSVDHGEQLGWQDAEVLVAKEYEACLNNKSRASLRYVSLHISLLIGASKVLVGGGLLILQGTHKKDTILAKALGLKPLLSDQVEQETESQIFLKQP